MFLPMGDILTALLIVAFFWWHFIIKILINLFNVRLNKITDLYHGLLNLTFYHHLWLCLWDCNLNIFRRDPVLFQSYQFPHVCSIECFLMVCKEYIPLCQYVIFAEYFLELISFIHIFSLPIVFVMLGITLIVYYLFSIRVYSYDYDA